MAFWKKKSDDPWDRDPNERPAVTFSEAEAEETGEPEKPEKKSFFADLFGGKEPEEASAPCPAPTAGRRWSWAT